jgi:inner membrane protein
MSSVIGHIAAGTSAYLACNKLNNKKTMWLLPIFVFLAICPDLDYLAIWIFKTQITPRFSHSVLFALCTALVVWAGTTYFRKSHPAQIPFMALFAASFSHPLLDFLVGAHSLPLLWPFTNTDVLPPIGILPSAGRLTFNNYYLWRNLFIELGVLLPVFTAIIMFFRLVPYRIIMTRTIMLAPIWFAFLLWSISLKR